MMPNRFLAAAVLAAALFAAAPASATDQPLTGAQKEAVQKVIRDYLRENPEVVIEAIEAYRDQQRKAESEQAKRAISAMGDMLLRNQDTPAYGNDKGDVAVVEFFDYNCGYCKRAFKDLADLVKEDGKVRVVFKELPILGDDSVAASRVSLAVWQLDRKKYFDLHAALMALRGGITEAKAIKAATDLGLSETDLRKAMDSEAVAKEIGINRHMAQILGISGTPAFIVGEELFPGAADREEMNNLVERARKMAAK